MQPTRRQLILSVGLGARIAAQEPVFRADSRLVLLDVQVLERDGGKPIATLVRQDFEIDDEGRAREIRLFEFGSTPLDLVLLVDIGGSMIEASRAMAQTLGWAVQELRPGDRVAVATFSGKVTVVLPFSPPTNKIQQATQQAVQHISRVEPGTHLFDALAEGARLFQAEGPVPSPRRRALLAVTDDKESGSKMKIGPLIAALLKADAAVNAVIINTRDPQGGRRIARIGLPIPGVPPITDDRRLPGPKQVYHSMERVVNETGGEMTRRNEREDFLAEMFARIRARYLLGFYSDTLATPGSFRRVTLRLSQERAKQYPSAVMRARSGYYFL
ncbi:MAG: VWA domain-containing protein [Chloroflexi bacterium]|nr:VWA domain-containing protein [Chloroflexota bacterium]